MNAKRLKRLMAAAFFIFAAGRAVFGDVLSGTVETTVTAGTGASSGFFYSAEEYANLRLKVPVGEFAAVYGAFNLIAVAGNAAVVSAGLPTGTYAAGENFAAALELERLYVQLSGESLGLSTGLLRIPLGYSTAWGPMDFLNPRNPLKADARLRAVLGILGSWYPLGGMKFFGFAAAPRNSADPGGGGSRFGLGWENHRSRTSLQFLVSFESPHAVTAPAVEGYPLGLYRFGFSFKADLAAGLVTEVLYTLDPDSPGFPSGLSAAAGFDCSFFDGKCYVLAEYLYSGTESASAAGTAHPWGRRNNHYLYGSLAWRLSDYTAVTLAAGACLDDQSAVPSLRWEHHVLQGIILSLETRLPLDGESFGNGNAGEFGPTANGSRFSVTAGLRVKF